MKASHSFLFLTCMALIMAACNTSSGDEGMSVDEASAIARKYIAINKHGSSDFDLKSPPTYSWEEDRVWVLKWPPKQGQLGGAVTFVVDKEDKEVLVALTDQ